MAKMSIEQLKKMSDDDLRELLGYDKKIATFKEDIAKADGLSGDARKIVEDRIESMFTPNIYVEDLKYTIQDAERQAKRKRSGKDEICSCDCNILD